MRVFPCLISASLAAMLVSACQPQGDAPAPGPAEPAVVATVQVPAASTQVPPDVTLAVVPSEVHACEGRDVVASKIQWTVTRPGIETVQVFVSGPGSERKLFTEGGATGDAETGKWLSASSVIELVDPKTGASLGKHTMSALPCD